MRVRDSMICFTDRGVLPVHCLLECSYSVFETALETKWGLV